MIFFLCLSFSVLLLAQHPAGEHMHRRFEDPEAWTKTFDDPARDEWQMPDRVIEALQLKPGQSVADIGAGTGYFTIRLAKSPAAPAVFAVDVEASMLRYIEKRAAAAGLKNVKTVQGSAASANLPSPVDRILIVDTFHHIPDRTAYFKALRKSLRPGGRLAIIDWLPGGPKGPPPQFRFAPEAIEAELAKAGWKKTGAHTFLPYQSFTLFGL